MIPGLLVFRKRKKEKQRMRNKIEDKSVQVHLNQMIYIYRESVIYLLEQKYKVAESESEKLWKHMEHAKIQCNCFRLKS